MVSVKILSAIGYNTHSRHILGVHANIITAVTFQQLLANKHHRLRDSKSRTLREDIFLNEWRSASAHQQKKQEYLLDLVTALKKN